MFRALTTGHLTGIDCKTIRFSAKLVPTEVTGGDSNSPP
jgi:hypothetical protein